MLLLRLIIPDRSAAIDPRSGYSLMGKNYDALDEPLIGFIQRQQIYFVATSPRDDNSRINLSPKGLDTFRVLGPNRVAYLDLTGSGVETIAHLRENGRIVIMFCAFAGPANIVRLHGKGRAWGPADAQFEALLPSFPTYAGVRAIIDVTVEHISDSCGYGVPEYSYQKDRTALPQWALNKGEDQLAAFRAQHNERSIDGLPGLDPFLTSGS